MALKERLANYAHGAWSGWMKYLFSCSDLMEDGSVRIPPDKVERWSRQASTSYRDLPEDEKESDRAEASDIISIVKGELDEV